MFYAFLLSEESVQLVFFKTGSDNNYLSRIICISFPDFVFTRNKIEFIPAVAAFYYTLCSQDYAVLAAVCKNFKHFVKFIPVKRLDRFCSVAVKHFVCVMVMMMVVMAAAA